jgi:hypothetical protein
VSNIFSMFDGLRIGLRKKAVAWVQFLPFSSSVPCSDRGGVTPKGRRRRTLLLSERFEVGG